MEGVIQGFRNSAIQCDKEIELAFTVRIGDRVGRRSHWHFPDKNSRGSTAKVSEGGATEFRRAGLIGGDSPANIGFQHPERRLVALQGHRKHR